MSPETIFVLQITVLGFFATSEVVVVLTAAIGIDIEDAEVEEGKKNLESLEDAASRKVVLVNAAESQFHILFAGFTALFLSLFSCLLLVSASSHQVGV